MVTYKLDQHLKDLCDQNERYLNLYSTWVLNKRTCSDLLKNVVVHYPHFSMHDASHADAVLSKMEMLLGPRVQNLSPTDTWLLLHAAYAHDLGMVVEWKAIETKWSDQEFQDNLSYLESLQDEDLRKAVQFVRKTHDLAKEQKWPLETSRYVRLINAALFRGKHARISKDYIEFTAPELGLDLGHNHLIQPRLVKLLSQICRLHTEPLDQVMKLDYQTNGFDSDYAHPRFVAMMLRLGDLLDIDNGRFNAGAEAVSGGLPRTSEPHREKHEATTHLLVTPKEIRFRSNCPNADAYLETRRLVTWLEQEVDFLTKNWAKIVPEDLGGYAPRFDDKELLIKGVPDIEGVAGLRFEISQDKAFQMIEGANIYRDPMVFLREVIQNAMDASKLQLWSDLCSNTYLAWMKPRDEASLHTLQPYEIPGEVYQNYPITITLSAIDTDRVQIKVTDRGTGISVASFKRMCNVGESNESSAELRDILKKMPNWLRPTAGFGIGLQSIFLVTDQFTIDTSTGQEAFHAVVYSKRKGGYLRLQRVNDPMPRGTTICIETGKLDYGTYARIGASVQVTFDPMHDENRIQEMYILGWIQNLCESSMFPLYVQCREEAVDKKIAAKPLPVLETRGWSQYGNRYLCTLEQKDGKFLLWDKQEAVLEKMTFDRIGIRYFGRPSISFKGVNMEVDKPFYRWNLFFYTDIYGLDTKETVTLDRTQFTAKGKRRIQGLHKEYLKVFCDFILEKLKKEAFEPGKNFDRYSFWLNCDDAQREEIPKTFIQTIPGEVVVVVKGKDEKYHVVQKPVKDVIPEMERMTCAEVLGIPVLSRDDDRNKGESLCSLLNHTKGIQDDAFIVDMQLFQVLGSSHYVGEITMLGEQPSVLCYGWENGPVPVKVNEAMRKKVLLSLHQNFGKLFHERMIYERHRATRRATFAIEGYDALAVKALPDLMLPPTFVKSAWMIAPFVRADEEKRVDLGWSKETFAEQVMESEMFPRVVDWVVQHSIHQIPPSRKEIEKAYQKLMYDYCDVMEEKKLSSKESHT